MATSCLGAGRFSRESLQDELERITDLGGSASFPCAHALLVERIHSGQLAEPSSRLPAGPAGASALKPGEASPSREQGTSSGDAERMTEERDGAQGEGEGEDGEDLGPSSSGKVRSSRLPPRLGEEPCLRRYLGRRGRRDSREEAAGVPPSARAKPGGAGIQPCTGAL